MYIRRVKKQNQNNGCGLRVRVRGLDSLERGALFSDVLLFSSHQKIIFLPLTVFLIL